MSTWNYRIVCLNHKKFKDKSLGIYEVLYNDKGKPSYCAQDPQGSIIFKSWGKALTVKNLKKEFNMHAEAFKEPILYYPKDFVKEKIRKCKKEDYISADEFLKLVNKKKK